MKIIFLSLMFSEKQLDNAFQYSKCGVQMAPHTFQQNLCRGLEAIDGVSLYKVACPPIGSFPLNYQKLLIASEHSEDITSVGFLNVPKLKYWMQEQSIVSAVKPMLSDGEPTVLLVYTLHIPFMRAAYRLKQAFPQMKVCLIQTDSVPGIDDMEKHMTKEAAARGHKLLQLSRCCDGFVILTKCLKEPLQVGDRPYTVVEGIASELPVYKTDVQTPHKIKTFLYSGSLNTAYGIKELTEAFLLTEHKLMICGTGDYQPQLLKIINDNKRHNIEYLGFLPPEKLAAIRCSADFLINPRQPSGTYTKYSFPSKTMEYLASAVPTVMYRLEGIPDEYFPYLNFLTGTTPSAIAKELRQLCDTDYQLLANKAQQGRAFVMENKNELVQAKRVHSLLKELFK